MAGRSAPPLEDFARAQKTTIQAPAGACSFKAGNSNFDYVLVSGTVSSSTLPKRAILGNVGRAVNSSPCQCLHQGSNRGPVDDTVVVTLGLVQST